MDPLYLYAQIGETHFLTNRAPLIFCQQRFPSAKHVFKLSHWFSYRFKHAAIQWINVWNSSPTELKMDHEWQRHKWTGRCHMFYQYYHISGCLFCIFWGNLCKCLSWDGHCKQASVTGLDHSTLTSLADPWACAWPEDCSCRRAVHWKI